MQGNYNLSTLPMEVLEMIAMHLPFGDMENLRRVSRLFHLLGCRIDGQLKVFLNVKHTSIQLATLSRARQIKMIQIHCNLAMNNIVLETIGQNCLSLVHLDISFCPGVTLNGLKDIVINCENLKSMVLMAHSGEELVDTEWIGVISECRNLFRLGVSLKNNSDVSALEKNPRLMNVYLQIQGEFEMPLNFGKRLKFLAIDGGKDFYFSSIVDPLERLNELVLNGWEEPWSIEELVLADSPFNEPHLTLMQVVRLVGSFPSLKKIALIGASFLNDEVESWFLEYLKTFRPDCKVTFLGDRYSILLAGFYGY